MDQPGEEDQRTDDESRDRLTKIQLGYERWARRTFWALAVIGATFVVTVSALVYLIRENANTSERITSGRAVAVMGACRNDQAQDNVLRALILASLREQERRGASKGEQVRGRQLSEQLLAPLGGLEPSQKQLDAQCMLRLARAVQGHD